VVTFADGGNVVYSDSDGTYFVGTWTFDDGANILTVCANGCESTAIVIVNDDTISIEGYVYLRQ
jgi:hypothetical protein